MPHTELYVWKFVAMSHIDRILEEISIFLSLLVCSVISGAIFIILSNEIVLFLFHSSFISGIRLAVALGRRRQQTAPARLMWTTLSAENHATIQYATWPTCNDDSRLDFNAPLAHKWTHDIPHILGSGTCRLVIDKRKCVLFDIHNVVGLEPLGILFVLMAKRI